ncbi:unnamed protein product [Caenorhabditis angaria]|uniref:Poly [ADP-ribose] polymerase n=1 Tax=Caenorhabditis angaria TaxID=860376 RepID=A0A9P1ICA2_9PELO|nr:unnamed protein product [Caenorhabditis angaria]
MENRTRLIMIEMWLINFLTILDLVINAIYEADTYFMDKKGIIRNGVPIFKGGLSDIEEESELLYDEYVVYDSEKFRIKYVVELETNKLTPQEMMNLMI